TSSTTPARSCSTVTRRPGPDVPDRGHPMRSPMRTLTRRVFLRGSAAGAIALGLAADLAPAAARAHIGTPLLMGDEASSLAELSASLTGAVLLPADPGYDRASTPANGRYRDIRPLAVAQCADEADVATCVNWCRASGVPPV